LGIYTAPSDEIPRTLMEVIQHSICYDLYHCYGTRDADIAPHSPGYDEGSKTARQSPGQCFDYAAAVAVIQDPSLFLSW